LQIWAADISKEVVGSWKVSLELKNSGKDVGTNIVYWKGEVFRLKGATDPMLSDDSGETSGGPFFKQAELKRDVFL